MKNKRILLQVLLSMAIILSLVVPASAAGASVIVPQPDDHSIGHSTVDRSDLSRTMILNTPPGNVTPMVAARGGHTVGLKSDGTVVAVTFYGFIDGLGPTGSVQHMWGGTSTVDVSDWTSIIYVATGTNHIVGLKADATAVAVGYKGNGQCEIGDWTDITQVAAGGGHTVGLKHDGTVVAVGWNQYTQCDVGDWTDITQIAAGYDYTVGLKSDGTVVAVGYNEYGQCDVGNWRGIVQVATGGHHTVGVKSDGTVVAVGYNYHEQCSVAGWADIIQVAAAPLHTVGLKSDGTVVAVGEEDIRACDVDGWADIVQIAAGYCHTVGLKSDGTVVATGSELNPNLEPVESEALGRIATWNLGVTQYNLSISSTAGGSVTTPGDGIYTYTPRTTVNLVAEPEEGYRFVRWAGDVNTVGRVNAASTTITMHGDYSITANFRAHVNWALIGGIIAAVVVVGLVIFFMRRRRAAPTK